MKNQKDQSAVKKAESKAHNMQYYEVSAKTKQPKSLEDVLLIALEELCGSPIVKQEGLDVED